MLPPIPHSLAPVTAQQDVPKPRPEIAPVTPSSESSKESAIDLDRRHPQDAEMRLREEQRRRRQARYNGEPDDPEQAEDEDAVDERPRQGGWVDVQV